MKFLPRAILILLALQAASPAFRSALAQPANIPSPPAISALQSSQPPASTPDTTAPATPPQSSEKKVTAYTLPPDLYRKARDLGRFHARFAWIDFFYGIFLLWTMAVLGLPSDIYENSVERKYGLSIQSWGSWFWDWTKGQFLGILLGIILVSILYAVIRSSPRRWWFYFWLTSLPIIVLLVFIQPVIVDPLFHKFEPLQQKDPALTVSLEKMVQRAGVN